MNRGKLIIVTIFIVAAAMSGYACWHHYRGGHRVIETWGADAAWLIQHAEKVELLHLGDVNAQVKQASDPLQAPEMMHIGDSMRAVDNREDISARPGLIHARHVLIVDGHYRWDLDEPNCESSWEFALRFSHKQRQVTIVFDTSCQRVLCAERQQSLTAGEMFQRIATFLEQR